MKNKIIWVLSALVLGLSGYMLYNSFNGEMSEAEIKTEFSNLKTDYEFLQKDLESKVNTLNTSNKLILIQKQKIEMLFRKNAITEEELLEAKKIMRSISQSVLESYQSKVKDLEKEKSGLLTEKQIEESELLKLNKKIINLENEKKQINTQFVVEKQNSDKKDQMLKYASRLSLSNFILKSFKVRSNGKEIETDKASRISRIKIIFDINENKLAESGTKELYIVVYKPDGGTLTFEGKPTDTFIFEGKRLTYSDKMSINYIKGEKKTVETVWDNEEFKRGDYAIEVYEKTRSGYTNIGRATKTLE